MNVITDWQQCRVDEFWSEIAPGEHVLQLYDNDANLLETLSDYAMDGFYAGDSVIIIATATHLLQLNNLFRRRGLNTKPLVAAGQYVPLDAADTLSKFMINNVPNELCFVETVYDVVKKARGNGRNVRAFGEMVAILWDAGLRDATIQLEQLWNKFCKTESLSLFCAHPNSIFNDDATASVMHICAEHSRLISPAVDMPAKMQYKLVV